ncbi:MAG: LON peptidase substrate-binding domain-containing protein [Anaerolineae bacterium]
MMQLSLFPLNSVLFPGMPLRLHIFEERYKEMINECIDTQQPFGVVLIEDGRVEGGAMAKPHMIGTTAHISQVQRLAYGRMNILAVGRDRFRINQLDMTARSFLTGDVDLLPLVRPDDAMLSHYIDRLQPLLERYLTSLSEAGQVKFDSEQFPTDPMSIAYLGAVLLQAEDHVKQDILESADTQDLLIKLLRMYRKEVSLIDVLLSPPEDEEHNDTPFSLS